MSIKEQLMADVKSAMKNKEQDKLTTLRFAHSAIKNKEIEVRPNEITENDVTAVLKKLVKQRKDSIEQYEKAGRQDLADKESFELKIIEEYLPEQMSKEKIEALVVETISELNASSMKDMGQVMKMVTEKSAGNADGKTVSEIVRAKLQ